MLSCEVRGIPIANATGAIWEEDEAKRRKACSECRGETPGEEILTGARRPATESNDPDRFWTDVIMKMTFTAGELAVIDRDTEISEFSKERKKFLTSIKRKRCL